MRLLDFFLEIKDWNNWASVILKTELTRRNITYEQLRVLLSEIGVHETMPSILNKMSRGSFQFVFFLQCASAIKLTVIDLNQYSLNNNENSK